MTTEQKILSASPISCFADEIDPALDRQIAVLQDLDLHWIELRSADGTGVADFTPDQAKDIKKRLDAAGIRVSAIGSPIGKIKVTDNFDEHMKKLAHVESLADLFETPYIRMFSFYIPEGSTPEACRDEVMKRMDSMVKEASRNHLTLLHENEKGIFGDIAPRCLDLMKQFYGDSFKCTFDFANFIQCNQDTLKAYDILKPYIHYIHIKDALKESGKVVPAGSGDGNLKAILSAQDSAGFNGFLSLEPHLADFAGLSSLEQHADVRGENDTEKAFRIAIAALRKLLST